MTYLIMEARLSSFPMIPISLVYSFSGMNDSFMNGVGVPSVKCQISTSAGIGGQYLPQYKIFCYMTYLIMEARLSSFPMIPISLVYSFSGMNDSFMNGVGVPSVKCQISTSAGIGGQYLPQHNIFCYMTYLIMEARLSSFPMIPISLVYSFSGMNDSFMNGVGVPSVKCQISTSAGIGGQYLPQYNIFCYMSYLIMEA